MAAKKLIQWTEKALIKKIESWMEEKIEILKDFDHWEIQGYQSGLCIYFMSDLMQNCCGIAEIGTFDEISKDDNNHPVFTNFSIYPYVIALIVKRIMEYRKTCTVVCSTARKVKEPITALEKIIKKVGFTRYTSSRNPKSGNIVTLWGYSKRG